MIVVARASIVAAARAYIGTPFHHQGRLKGVGIDCAGLIACVAEDIGIPRVTIPPYPRQPNPQQFRAILRSHMDQVDPLKALPGDVLSFKFTEEQHLAILTDAENVVHADSKFGRVIENPMRRAWKIRVVSAWRYRVEFA